MTTSLTYTQKTVCAQMNGFSKVTLLLCILLVASPAVSSAPWAVSFGGCTFSGDTNGAPLFREGSCSSTDGTLSLSSKGISSIHFYAFEGITRVSFLHLHGNQLTGLPGGVFAGMSELRHLTLANNKLTELPVGLFAELPNLRFISLNANQLTVLPVDLFAWQWELSSLYLSDNKLTTLPAGVFISCPNLAYLTLNNNNFTELPSGVFTGLSALTTLHISGTRLKCVPLTTQQRDALEIYNGPEPLCACKPGSTGPPAVCALCVAGKYKSEEGSALCIDCAAATYSSAVGASQVRDV